MTNYVPVVVPYNTNFYNTWKNDNITIIQAVKQYSEDNKDTAALNTIKRLIRRHKNNIYFATKELKKNYKIALENEEYDEWVYKFLPEYYSNIADIYLHINYYGNDIFIWLPHSLKKDKQFIKYAITNRQDAILDLDYCQLFDLKLVTLSIKNISSSDIMYKLFCRLPFQTIAQLVALSNTNNKAYT